MPLRNQNMVLKVVPTVVFWVLCDSDVEEGGPEPLQCNRDISDGV